MKTKLWALGLAMVLCGMGTAVAAEPAGRVVTLDISARPLGDALAEFGKQADISIVLMGADLKKGMNSRALAGKFAPEAALVKLLEGTGLRYEYLDEKTIAIRGRKEGEKTSDASPADQMRVAAAKDSAGPLSNNEKESRRDDQIITVKGERDSGKPFSDGNLDIPRTTDDAQTYTIFDRRALEDSGATSIEEFLKQRLTMNTSALSNSQLAGSPDGSYGNLSAIDLRGLGTGKTLVLVNGRRMAGVRTDFSDYYGMSQPDLNGIPISAIERIEVLPSSASGIYGGSAIGGVINVVLKKDYSGAELRVGYDNTLDADAPIRSVSGTYGRDLRGGKTHVTLMAQWSDASPLLMQDRRRMLERNIGQILQNHPVFFYDVSGIFDVPLGRQINIQSAAYNSDYTAVADLQLKNGPSLGSPITTLPGSVNGNTPAPELRNQLRAGAGTYNLELPEGTGSTYSLGRPFGQTPETRAVQLKFRSQLLSWVEGYIEASHSSSEASSVRNPLCCTYNVPGALASNPFTSDVAVSLPLTLDVPSNSQSLARSVVAGFRLQLPHGWVGDVSHNISRSKFSSSGFYGNDLLRQDVLSGMVNPFVGLAEVEKQLDLDRYLSRRSYASSSESDQTLLRFSGSLPSLPSGAPSLTVGVERIRSYAPAQVQEPYRNAISGSLIRVTQFAREQVADGAYAEAGIPLIKPASLPLLYELSLQVAGRIEHYTVDAGTAVMTENLSRNPPTITWRGVPPLNGQPYVAKDTYSTKNHTVGLHYQPLAGLTVRTSLATAFQPPTPDMLIPNPLPSIMALTDNNGRTHQNVEVTSGGNPDIKPQDSESLVAGFILEPLSGIFRGLRFSADYYRTRQKNWITSLGAQQIVGRESEFGGRITRSANGAIIAVDDTMFNLYGAETTGWDLTLKYGIDTPAGYFSFYGAESIVRSLNTQFSSTDPAIDTVGLNPLFGGVPKYKATAGLGWERGRMNVGWSMSYTDSYSLYHPDGYLNEWGAMAQGATSIPSQKYHDLLLGYTFEQHSGGAGLRGSSVRLLSGVALKLGVRNVFNTEPPLDIQSPGTAFASSYGSTRLRSYWLNLVKTL